MCGDRRPVGLLKQAAAIRRHALRNQFVPQFRRELEPHMDREIREGRAAVRSAFGTRDTSEFDDWVQRFYPQQERRMARALLALISRYGALVTSLTLEEIGSDRTVDTPLFARRFARGLAGRWSRESIKQLRQLVRDVPEDLDEALMGRFGEWEETRTGWVAQVEATQANGAFAKHTYLLDGVQQLRWLSIGESCPLCERLNGQVVEITRPFLDEGAELTAGEGEAQTTLRTEKVVGHPPLHGMGGKGGVCDCVVVAAA